MNHYDRNIAETIYDHNQKVYANRESIQRSSNDIDANTPGVFTLRAMHRNKYGRLPVSNYDDPRWYEQPDDRFAPATDDQFSPTSAANEDTSIQLQTSSEEHTPDSKRRRGRIFGQIVVTAALLMIAFLGGWFSHQAYTNTGFDPSNQSKSYANLIQQAWNTVDQ